MPTGIQSCLKDSILTNNYYLYFTYDGVNYCDISTIAKQRLNKHPAIGERKNRTHVCCSLLRNSKHDNRLAKKLSRDSFSAMDTHGMILN
jgi:hypothetical protein